MKRGPQFDVLKQRWIDAIQRLRLALDGTRGGRFLLDIGRGIQAIIHHLRREPVFDPAAALAYGTLLSIVPLLGVVLAIVGGLQQALVRKAVHDAIFTFLAPGIQRASQEYLEQVIERATSGGMVSLSGGALLVSAVMLLRSVEKTLNKIWGVEALRDWRIRFPTYLLILIAGPVLLGVSLAATAALRHRVFEHVLYGDLLLGLAPILAAMLGLTLLYWLAPNAHVRKRAAFAGAVVSGLAFEVAKYAYAYYTGHFVHYNVIYGSLGAIPLFLVWVYVAWVILLFGARLAYAVQHAGSFGMLALPQAEGARARLAARLLVAAAVARAGSRPTPSIETLSRVTGVAAAAVAETVRILVAGGLLKEDGEGGLEIARPAESISLAEVAEVARTAMPLEPDVLGVDSASVAIGQAFTRSEVAGLDPLAKVSVRSMAEPLLAADSPPA